MQVTNTIAFGFSLLGTSVVIRRLGLRLTLLIFPGMCLAVAVTVMLLPRLDVSADAGRHYDVGCFWVVHVCLETATTSSFL